MWTALHGIQSFLRLEQEKDMINVRRDAVAVGIPYPVHTTYMDFLRCIDPPNVHL